MTKENEPGVISINQVAQLLMLTTERVRQLANEGYIQKAGRGRFHMVSAVQGYIRYLKDAERRSSKSAAATRAQDVKLKREELALAKEQRELVSQDEVHEVLDFMSSKFREAFAGLPASFTRDKDLRRRLEADVNERFEQLSKDFEQAARVAQEGGDLFKTS